VSPGWQAHEPVIATDCKGVSPAGDTPFFVAVINLLVTGY
jgi:hypothetical protein